MREVSSRSRHDGTCTEEGTAAGHCCFEISKEAEEHAQRDFVACRRSDRNLKAADLHRWLTMARLFALSHGDTKVRSHCSKSRLRSTTDVCLRCAALRVQLTPAHWEAMKGMEAARTM